MHVYTLFKMEASYYAQHKILQNPVHEDYV